VSLVCGRRENRRNQPTNRVSTERYNEASGIFRVSKFSCSLTFTDIKFGLVYRRVAVS